MLYGLTIFLSAFLLFQIQPMIAKMILPWFGGSAAVWSTALMFFQVALLAGYSYSYLLTRFVSPRHRAVVHCALLLASLLALPAIPSEAWKPVESGAPAARILGLLAATIGLPYFLLSTTGPLVQAWYVAATASPMPYRLYALSNAGSLLALLTFPIAFEPTMTTRAQAYSWSVLYVLFAALCAWTALRSGSRTIPET
ncbi:MAG TPA: hypothetical protein VE621_09075, partial [Bryobacteraceae bacterium]|nr:hypothetical protein [Bryobacteraceae bacterium]